MNKVTGKVESMSKKGNSIKVGGEWYSVAPQAASTALKGVQWKDEVEFLYEQKGQYKNIKGVVTVTSGAGHGVSGGSGGRASGGYSNLGVEVGHAANLAIQMMEQRLILTNDSVVVGSKDYYKDFAQYTLEMYKVMKGIRAKLEAPVVVAPPVQTEEPTLIADIDDGDIF